MKYCWKRYKIIHIIPISWIKQDLSNQDLMNKIFMKKIIRSREMSQLEHLEEIAFLSIAFEPLIKEIRIHNKNKIDEKK